jgi:hypothetical protein
MNASSIPGPVEVDQVRLRAMRFFAVEHFVTLSRLRSRARRSVYHEPT